MADLGLYENFLEHARVTECILNRRHSAFLREMEVAFQIPEPEFVGLFRLSKSVCRDLIQELEPYLPTRRGGMSITCKVGAYLHTKIELQSETYLLNCSLFLFKVLSALSFYASGSYQRSVGASAHHKMHQVSVSNCVRAVTTALNNNHFRYKYIHFPQTLEERNMIKNR